MTVISTVQLIFFCLGIPTQYTIYISITKLNIKNNIICTMVYKINMIETFFQFNANEAG